MADVKKMIQDYDDMLASKRKIFNNYVEKLNDLEAQIAGISSAMNLIVNHKQAVDILREDQERLINVSNNYIRFCADAEKELLSVVEARKSFMKVMQMNCDHDWIFDFTDGHNGDDHYHCSICGKHN